LLVVVVSQFESSHFAGKTDEIVKSGIDGAPTVHRLHVEALILGSNQDKLLNSVGIDRTHRSIGRLGAVPEYVDVLPRGGLRGGRRGRDVIWIVCSNYRKEILMERAARFDNN
jgi:hypothetical protein